MPESIDAEEFFMLFHEPFFPWVMDLKAIRANEEASPKKDEAILHFVSRIERLCALLSAEHKEHFSKPLPRETWSAKIMQEHFRELNEIARSLLLQKGKPQTMKKLAWLAEVNLESVIRSGGK